TRRERLPGLPDLGTHQCGVPGCDWRFNPNTNSHSDGNSHSADNNDSDPNCHSPRFRQSNPDTQTNAHSEIACDTAATSDSSPAVAVIIHACASRYVMIKISYDISLSR